jgi:VanZ family protein
VGSAGLKFRLFVTGAIAWVVGIFDEIHQLSVPGRGASAGDVVLDMVGIAIALLLCFVLFKTRISKQTKQTKQTRQTRVTRE